MKITYFLTALFLVSFFARASTDTIDAQTSTSSATVYLQGATLQREANISLPSGQVAVTFRGLSASVDPASIQLEGRGDFTLVNTRFSTEYPKEPAEKPELKKLRLALEAEKEKLQHAENERDVFAQEEEMLLSNRQIGGEKSGYTFEELQKITSFFRSRLSDIKSNRLQWEKEIRERKEEIQRLQSQINALRQHRREKEGVITALFQSEKAQQVKLQLHYFLYSARWEPFYELHIKDTEDPAKLEMKARMHQNSGEDWKNIKLTLSTGQPRRDNTPPQLRPWRLDFVQEHYGNFRGGRASKTAPLTDGVQIAREEADMESAPMKKAGAEMATRMLAYTYTIDRAYDLPSSGQEHLVHIREIEIPAIYEYMAVPKISRDVFLLAKLYDWEEFNLLPAETGLYLEGLYTGKTHLRTNETSDTLEISLGREENISLDREKITSKQSRQFLSKKVKREIHYKTEVRNNKQSAVKIRLYDQFPLSENSDIQFKQLETSGGQVDSETGEVLWILTLSPGQNERKDLKYEVTYPKDKKLWLE